MQSLKRYRFFKAANITEVILSTFTIVSVLVRSNRYSLERTSDIVLLAVLITGTAVINWNCISNLLLAHTLNHVNSKAPRRSAFIARSILFSLACIGSGICVTGLLMILTDSATKAYINSRVMIFSLSWFSLLTINGLYILLQQIALFKHRKKKYRSETAALIDTLGEVN